MDQLNDIIVFEINISKVQAQSKLSQNREQRDFDSVVKKLQEKGKRKKEKGKNNDFKENAYTISE